MGVFESFSSLNWTVGPLGSAEWMFRSHANLVWVLWALWVPSSQQGMGTLQVTPHPLWALGVRDRRMCLLSWASDDGLRSPGTVLGWLCFLQDYLRFSEPVFRFLAQCSEGKRGSKQMAFKTGLSQDRAGSSSPRCLPCKLHMWKRVGELCMVL